MERALRALPRGERGRIRLRLEGSNVHPPVAPSTPALRKSAAPPSRDLRLDVALAVFTVLTTLLRPVLWLGESALPRLAHRR